jgi:heme/copper-type cytochrome/quinol oxidase subunit 1
MELHTWILWAAMALGIAQIPFIINLFWSIKHGEKVKSDNPWQRHDARMADAHAAAARQFCHAAAIYRGPYEYSVPGHATDFTPQNENEPPIESADQMSPSTPPSRFRRALIGSFFRSAFAL